MSISEFARKLRARELKALELTEACLRRIDELQPRLNAFIRVMGDDARRDAAAADRELAGGRDRGPLHGVPIAVKDLIDIAGVPTTAASRVREGHVAAADAPVITHLRTGHPAISILCGATSEGLPCGLQLVGHRSQTAALLAIALEVEERLSVRSV